MPLEPAPTSQTRAQALLGRALARAGAPREAIAGRVAVVDAELQRLYLLVDGRLAAEYRVSTAAAGIGGASGSMRTPPGWHRVHRKIGAGQPAGAVFESREPTGAVWRGEAGGDLILTRILTLAGLEPGVNQGGDRDSLARYIYLHGTNDERRLGTPASHGCVRLANAAVLDLFDRLEEGDPVVIVGLEEVPDPVAGGRFHYAAVAGSGMSALAQFQAMLGGSVSGSDRDFDRGERPEARAQLERLGIDIHAQDGSGVTADCAAMVVSTAVEDQVPDVVSARMRGVPVLHRSTMLAHWVRAYRTIAVTGTSGKSTTVAMVFEILRGAGRDPSVLTGGELPSLRRQGLWGNAWRGGSDLLVIEADESDGTLTRYAPAIGVVLNLQRDHKEMGEVARMFETFRAQTRERLVVGEAENLRALREGAVVFGLGPEAAVRGEDVQVGAGASELAVEGVRFRIPVPGRHNVQNALAAIATARLLGVELAAMVEPLAGFQGVGRRFESLGTARGVEVVDDFAHNPSKVTCAIETAQARARRVLAVYQPHGYGPTRFLRADFVEAFTRALRPADRLWLLEVFYAGGTAVRDFSAADIAAEIAARGAAAEFAPSREGLLERIAAEAREGDLVLIMGARDPSLTELARAALGRLGGAPAADAAPAPVAQARATL